MRLLSRAKQYVSYFYFRISIKFEKSTPLSPGPPLCLRQFYYVKSFTSWSNSSHLSCFPLSLSCHCLRLWFDKVSRFRYIDRIDTPQRSILQVSSEIKGKLPYDWQHHLGEIICSMLPAGSISGAPKQATINLIKRAEGEPRGFYSGVFGYYNGEVLDSAVMIRYIEQVGSQYYFRSGGGITVNSDCLSEYNEVIAKIYLPTL